MAQTAETQKYRFREQRAGEARYNESGNGFVESPASSVIFSASDESMLPASGRLTPPESPPHGHSPGAESGFVRLSLEEARHHPAQPTSRGRGAKNIGPSKRAPSSELQRECGRPRSSYLPAQDPRSAGVKARGAAGGRPWQRAKDCRPRPRTLSSDIHDLSGRQRTGNASSFLRGGRGGPFRYQTPDRQDSGYVSRKATLPDVAAASCRPPSQATFSPVACPSPKAAMAMRQPSLVAPEQKAKWPEMLPPPMSCLITEAQLTAEIKAIYAGVVVVEAKCMNVDAAEANDPSPDFDQARWQALIGLHRTLLYEHHDFLMATQHPSATPALRALPTKYSMPARMWKHAIHGFLEVLRHRRPELQDYMVSFIYLAYSMVTLLYETVTAYLDTWIECLGDLARYRMAIELDREEHAQWASVAASWYIKASDRHPQIGRLYHHLAILERPSLRKIACYGKSLTCVVPFLNARESLSTLCKPIAEEAQPARQIALQAEAAFCKLHALIFLAKPDSEIQPAFNIAFSFLQRSDAFKWRECGVPLAVANISALLGHGAPSNPLRIAFDRTIRQHVQRTRQSQAGHPLKVIEPPQPPTLSATEHEESRRLVTIANRLTLASFHTCLRCHLPGTATLRDSFAFVNVMFCFLHSISLTKNQNGSEPESSMALNMVFGLDEVDWGDVASFLTILTTEFSVSPHIVACAQQKVWPEGTGDSSVVLPEDWAIRGLVWAYFAFCPEWFKSDEDQDQGRTTETVGMDAIRARRIQYYALRIAYETGYLSYDERTRIWAGRSTAPPPRAYHATPGISAGVLAQSPRPSARSTGLASPATTARSLSVSSRSSNQQQSQPAAFKMQNQVTTPRWADVARQPAPKQAKSRRTRAASDNIKVYDEEEVEMEYSGRFIR